jgi:hypothetical protein
VKYWSIFDKASIFASADAAAVRTTFCQLLLAPSQVGCNGELKYHACVQFAFMHVQSKHVQYPRIVTVDYKALARTIYPIQSLSEFIRMVDFRFSIELEVIRILLVNSSECYFGSQQLSTRSCANNSSTQGILL